MTTYEQIADNKRKTWLLSLIFPFAFAALAYITILVVSPFLMDERTQVSAVQMANYYAVWIIPISMFVATMWIVFSYYSGDHILLSAADAYEIQKRDLPEVYTLVENVCITMGLPYPKVYVINDESLNAFATGRDPQHASIALTSGIIKKLDRQELEAVIAHEMGHVINRDITLMLIIVAGISFFSLASSFLLRMALYSNRGRGKNKGGAMIIILAAAVLCLVFANIIAPLIRLAISRSREYLADATSAHTTRNPHALANALRKISQDSRVESLDKMTSMAAMCIESPLSGSGGLFGFLSGLTSTHPPINKRIEALERIASGR